MEITMKAAIWQVMVDVAIMGTLLLIGQMMRAKIKLFQKVLVPPSVLAGILALIFGPMSPIEALKILPLSGSFGTYASMLIVVVFAATPIGDRPRKGAESGPKISGMFFNITGIAILQYGIGMLLTITVLTRLYPTLHDTFGLMLATGFYGGHGTAAAVGAALADLGVEGMTDLGNTTATIGIVGGIITGVIVINWVTRKGYTHYVDNPKNLPSDLLTGLVPEERQKASTKGTVNSICLDPLGFHIAIVFLAAWIGYMASHWFELFTAKVFNYGIAIPGFCLSLFAGLIIKTI